MYIIVVILLVAIIICKQMRKRESMTIDTVTDVRNMLRSISTMSADEFKEKYGFAMGSEDFNKIVNVYSKPAMINANVPESVRLGVEINILGGKFKQALADLEGF